ncbi:MAG: LPS O-antigen length regulator [Gammaproteobacteria bacterium]|nr:LPS O-antigen length regulator [Gammaproteobacteria bacterium]
MNIQNQTAPVYDDEIDLKELFSVLWAGKKLIIVITGVFAVISVFYSLSIPNQYKASALLAPAQQQNGGLSGALGDLSGLAAIAGVNVGGVESSEAQIAQEIIVSRGFIEKFLQQNDLAVEIFAADSWDSKNNQLSIDDDLYDIETQQWVRNPPAGKTVNPTSWELYQRFIEDISISADKKTGLITLTVEYFSPFLAKQWVDQLIVAINQHMQQRKLQKVNSNIEYLEAQIAKSPIAEMKEVFYTIIEEQIKGKMLAEASPEYVFVTVNPAMVPEEKSQPKRALICILGVLLGGMLSVVFVLIRYYSFSR